MPMSTLPPPSPVGQEPLTSSLASPMKVPGALPRVFSTLLVVAAITSVLSTLAFVGYLLVPSLAGKQPQAHFVALYAAGIAGLAVAEACQILGVVTLLGQWFSRINAEKRPKELLVLLVSLIPYMVIIIFLITLIVYLRARRADRDSERTREAGQELREQVVDTLIDAGANTSSNTAGSYGIVGSAAAHPAALPTSQTIGAPAQAPASPAMPRPSARPSMRDAVRQVVGPVTGKSVSEAANGLVAITLVALLLSTVATLGVVVPSRWLAPLQGSVRTSTSPAPLTMVAGTWNLTASNTRGEQANCQQGCALPTTTGALIPDAGSITVTVHQSGSTVTMTFTTPPTGTVSISGPVILTGTLSGGILSLSWSSAPPGESFQLSGSVLSANRMGGTFTYSYEFFTYTGDWTGTKAASPTSTPIALSGTWAVVLANCTATGGLTCDNPSSLAFSMVIRQSGKGVTVTFPGPMTSSVTLSGQHISISATATYSGTQTCHYALHMTGSVLAANRMGGSYSAQCTNDAGSVWATLNADWTATRS